MGTPVKVRFQEAEERPKVLEELGQRLQHYAKIAADFRSKVGAGLSPQDRFDFASTWPQNLYPNKCCSVRAVGVLDQGGFELGESGSE